jgi:hypothetical protein
MSRQQPGIFHNPRLAAVTASIVFANKNASMKQGVTQ